MPLAYETREGKEIAVPVARVADVAAARADRIAALAADFVSIKRGGRLVLEQVLTEIVVIDRSATKTMNADDHHIGLVLFGDPFAIAESFALRAGGRRVLDHDRPRGAGPKPQGHDRTGG